MSKYPGRIVTDLAPAGYSVYFDGTGDYLSAAANTALTFGTGDFTVEGWFYANALGGQPTILNNGSDAGGLVITMFSSKIYAYFVGAGNVFGSGGATLATNTWYHFAWVRSGSTHTFYLNGAVYGATYSSAGNHASTGGVGIGYSVAGTAFAAWNGYIANVRMVKGTALYTAAFTPPTQLLNITNTSLLTCNSPAIIDQSSNAFAITANGNAAVSTLTPFTAYVPYNPALGASTPGVWTLDEAMQAAATRQWNMYDPYFNLTTLLLHGNGTNGAQNNTFLDSSSNNFTITRNGNTTQGTFSPFSQTGWSTYYNGSSTFTPPAGLQTAFAGWGGRTRTWECWIYRDSTTSYNFQSAYNAVAANGRWYIAISGSNKLIFGWTTSTSTQTEVASVSSVPAGWVHLSVTVNSTTASSTIIYLGINGVVETFTGNDLSTQTSTYGWNDIFGNAIYLPAIFTGYATGLRWSSNLRYTSNYTVPTAPFTNDGNTLFLFGQQNRFSDQSSNAYTVAVAAGTPSVQAFSPFLPTVAYTPQTIGGSGYFDGTGDYLTTPSTAVFNVGTGNFTVETWIYPNAITANTLLFISFGTTNGIGVGFQATNAWGLVNSGVAWVLTTSTMPTVGQWNHLVVCRGGTGTNQTAIFLNGTRVTTGTVTTSFSQTSAYGIGWDGSNTVYNGYMSSLRVTNADVYGFSNSTITVPTAPLTAITNTQLLCNFTNAGVVDSTADNVLETVGNAQISTTQSKFGGSSMYFDGTGDWLIVPNNAFYNFGSSDFTIEFWWYPNTTADQNLISKWNSGTEWILQWRNAGNFRWAANGSVVRDATYTLSTGAWIHVAVSCASGNLRIFVNGTQIGTTATQSSITTTTEPVVIGAGQLSSTPLAVNGYFDEVRITRFARYTGNFTPQTSQWQDQ